MDMKDKVTQVMGIDVTGFSDKAMEAFYEGTRHVANYVGAMDHSRNLSWSSIERQMFIAFAILLGVSSETVDKHFQNLCREE